MALQIKNKSILWIHCSSAAYYNHFLFLFLLVISPPLFLLINAVHARSREPQHAATPSQTSDVVNEITTEVFPCFRHLGASCLGGAVKHDSG